MWQARYVRLRILLIHLGLFCGVCVGRVACHFGVPRGSPVVSPSRLGLEVDAEEAVGVACSRLVLHDCILSVVGDRQACRPLGGNEEVVYISSGYSWFPSSYGSCRGVGTCSIQSKLLSSWWMHPYMKASRCTVILDTATPLGPWEEDQQSVTALSVLSLTMMLNRSRHVGVQPAQATVGYRAGCFEGGPLPVDDVSDNVAVVGVLVSVLEVANAVRPIGVPTIVAS